MTNTPDTIKTKELIQGISEKLDNILLSCSRLSKNHTLITLDEYEFYYRGKKLTVFYKNTLYRYRNQTNCKKIAIYLKESMWKRKIVDVSISQYDSSKITYEMSCKTDALSNLYDRLNEGDVLLRLEVQHPDKILINHRAHKINFKTFNPFDINPK